MGAITVRRTVIGKMSAGVFAIGIAAFLLGFVHPTFFPFAWISLIGGALGAVVLWATHRRTSHPTVSHIPAGEDGGQPIHPK